MEKELLTNLTMELRRGTLILSVLSQLQHPTYGYALVQKLNEKELSIDANTLYPLLRRLEKQKLLESQWDVGESKPRKYYRRTPFGDTIYLELKEQWGIMSKSLEQLLKEE